jgi:hypothetical protein
LWVYYLALRHSNCDYRVVITRRVKGCFSGKSWHIHFRPPIKFQIQVSTMPLYFSPLGSDALCTSGHPMLALKCDRPFFDGTGKTFVDQTPSVENPYHPVIVSDEILMLGQVTTVSRRLQCRARTIRNAVRSRLIRSSKTDDFHVPRPSSQSSLPIFYVRQAWAYLFQVVLGLLFPSFTASYAV